MQPLGNAQRNAPQHVTLLAPEAGSLVQQGDLLRVDGITMSPSLERTLHLVLRTETHLIELEVRVHHERRRDVGR